MSLGRDDLPGRFCQICGLEEICRAFFVGVGTLESMLVQGPRQVERSAILEHFAPGHPSLVVLDDLALREGAARDPALLFSQYPSPILIDEFHYAPQLLPEIKRAIDPLRRRERRPMQGNTDHAPPC